MAFKNLLVEKVFEALARNQTLQMAGGGEKMWECKICGKSECDCCRGEISLADGTTHIFYICTICREKMTDNEIYRIVLRKLLH